MIAINNNFAEVIYERGEPEFDAAWSALIHRGYRPEAWMYMHSRPNVGGPGRITTHYFKNIDTRKYISVDVTNPDPITINAELLDLLKCAAEYVKKYEEWDEGELIGRIEAAIKKAEG